MDLDASRIDDATLALLLLGLHDGNRVWRSFDRDSLNRLHARGDISNPMGRSRSVVITPAGKAKAEVLLRALFGNPT